MRNLVFIFIVFLSLTAACSSGGDKEKSSSEEEAKEQSASKEMSPKMKKDIKKIEEYLSQNNIDATQAPSGVFYVKEEEGSGTAAANGKTVKVHYTGKLMKNGKKFDSSRDRGEPIEFELGKGMVIQGWEKGLTHFKEGGKGTLYIPSPLAYGSKGAGDMIPPGAILMFDVELVDVK
jgi:peptidylprolyl isomerase